VTLPASLDAPTPEPSLRLRLPRVLRTVSFRLAALYLILFSGSVTVLGAVVLVTARSALEQQMRAQIEAELTALEEAHATHGLANLVTEATERGKGNRAFDYLVEDRDGRRLAGDLPSTGGREGWLELRQGSGPGQAADGRDGARPGELELALGQRLPDGVLVAVGDDRSRVEEAQEAILRAFGLALGVTVVLGIGGGLALSAGFLKRVDAIASAAEAIVEGDLTRRVPEHGTDDDLDRLARTLNRMLDRISELMEGLRQVSSAVAHELRTPLARLRQRLEAAREGPRSVGAYAAAVDGAIGETDAVLDTFAALLRIAQIEAGTRRAAFRELDLTEVVQGVVEAFAPAAEDEGKALRADLSPGVRLQGDRDLLTQLVANLVDNAVRHTPPGTRITVSLGATRTGARLSVADDGPGVPEGDRAQLARRFYRSARSQGTPGVGLGLALVKAIADLHAARMTVADARPGLEVILDFGLGAGEAGHDGPSAAAAAPGALAR
jgi:signal transduction histidine kinase